MGRHALEPETEPIVLAGVWPTIEIPVRRRRPRRRSRPVPRRAARHGRVDGELVLTGVLMLALGVICAVLTLLTAGIMPQVAAWAWGGGGVTAFALSLARPAGGVDAASTGSRSVDRSSSVDVRTA